MSEELPWPPPFGGGRFSPGDRVRIRPTAMNPGSMISKRDCWTSTSSRMTLAQCNLKSAGAICRLWFNSTLVATLTHIDSLELI